MNQSTQDPTQAPAMQGPPQAPTRQTQPQTQVQQPGPTFEEQEPPMPEFPTANVLAPDVQFVIAVMAQCIASKHIHGGDTKYVAQGAFQTAREALGVLVASGVMQSGTIVRNAQGQNEPLWKSPAVPPMGQSARL